MNLQYTEIKQTPLENAKTTYQFCVADLREGLNYGITREVYNHAMQAIGSSLRVTDSTTNEKFCNDFYNEFK